MAIDHFCISVPKTKQDEIVAFYLKALEPLGYKKVAEFPGVVGLGCPAPDFWIAGKDVEASVPVHFAFTAKDRATVRAFHEAATAAGGKCNGPAGLRKHYHENFYGAFVYDPEGNNIEAVCHQPETEDSN